MAGKIGRNIPDHIYRALLARSGNKCAYPDCPNPIVSVANVYVAQLCHIESGAVKGERYNGDLKEEEVNGYDNLMFMCLKHHIVTDDVDTYTVDILKKMKYTHEEKYVENPFHIDMSHIYALKKEAEDFWTKVEAINNSEHLIPDLKVTINTNANYSELNEDIIETISSIDNLLALIDIADKNKYWEIFNLGFPNHLSKIKIVLEHMNIKYLEAYIASNPTDMASKGKLNDLRKNFLEITAKTSAHTD